MIENARSAQSKLELEESLNFCEVNAKLLSNLICDILDFSLFKENKLRVVLSNFSLDSVLSEVSKLLTFQAAEKKIQYVIENKTSKGLLFSDSQRLKQILINLLTNSIKFTQQGSIKLKVKEYISQNLLKFKVKDTGRGIKKENIKNLFKPFSTFDTEDGLNKTGIGLGLYICKNICSLLGPFNQLFVFSEWLQGTSIEFFLYKNMNSRKIKVKEIPPELAESGDYSAILTKYTEAVAEDRQFSVDSSIGRSLHNYKSIDENEMQSTRTNNIRRFDFLYEKNPFANDLQGASVRRSAHVKRRLNVLIVDDNVFNLLILENYLKKMDDIFEIHILKAYNGREVIDVFSSRNLIKHRDQPPEDDVLHIILMDCEMPDVNGFEASMMIRERVLSGDYHGCRIAACTAYSRKEERDRCVKVGMEYFLMKPISDQEIRNLFLDLF